ncbi:glycosyltransferase family 4 protein [Cellulomonas sp. Leaf395]|uniref:glycosyltransferase family 4 protein n=1 Tax=Cellulomonas sp. Leaf395 TaxID=1736362 RepID=UPI0006FBCFEB|nr:glycosyltransferase family 4 protein [Cellulomonas sp. Leaf395]KQS97476.1 glycosyl transferase [Cellulomonas sp. Leaf395]
MRILVWHVHGSWMTSFVQGPDEYLVPVDATRSRNGLGRARTWDWPASAREVALADLHDEEIDVVVLQRPGELELVERWTGRRPGVDVRAVYVEHNTPAGPAATTRHLLADRSDIVVAHVSDFNALMWDTGRTPTTVIDHGIPDPGYRYTGERARIAAAVNEPVRRWRVAGTDVLLTVAARVPVEVYGMGVTALAEHDAALAPYLHDDVPQQQLHEQLAGARAYLHPFRWTSLGLALIEAMTLGMPVLAVAATAVPQAVPADAGVVSARPDRLVEAGRRWLHDPEEARAVGRAAREHALRDFGLDRFLSDWQSLLKEVTR